MGKKTPPMIQVQNLCEEIHKSIDRWREIRDKGCSDPTWPDGTNMNLVRNHIIYYKIQIEEICDETGFPYPDEYFVELPPKVPETLWVGTKSGRRHELVLSFSRKLVYPLSREYRYDPQFGGQINLFGMI